MIVSRPRTHSSVPLLIGASLLLLSAKVAWGDEQLSIDDSWGLMPDAGLLDDGVPEEPSDAGASVAVDPALVRLRGELFALVEGRAPASEDLDALFSIPLDDPKPLRQRIGRLPSEILQMEERFDQLKQELSRPEALAPPVERPPLLDTVLTAPTEPVAPTAPVKPDRAAVRTYLRERRTPGVEDPREVYQRDLERYVQERAAYEQAMKEYAEARVRFETSAAAVREAEVAYQKALAERRRALADQVATLTAEVETLAHRIAVAKLRRDYLSGLAGLLDRLSEPGLEVFQSLRAPRTAIRRRAERIRQVAAAMETLADRGRVLLRRVEAGSLTGFQVQQNEVIGNLTGELRSFDRRVRRARQLAEALLALAEEIENAGRAERLHLLVSANDPSISEIADRTFKERLRESRRASRVPTGFAVTDTDLLDVQTRLGELLLRPHAVSTVADGEKALLEIRAAGEQLDKTLDALSLGQDRYRQAYKREIVTLYSGLASPEVKHRAYSFSYAFFEDFAADMNLLRVDLSLWFENRLDSVSHLSSHLQTREGQLRVVRIGGGLLLILVLISLRKRIRSRFARVILRLINLKTFRQRAGLLVRLTVFLLALVPIALVALSGYALLFLIGIEYPEVRIAEIAFRWALIYLAGRQLVLGLTRQERSGRPPLFQISLESFRLLRITYARLGLFLAVVAAVGEWSRVWMGTGSLNTMVRLVASAWLGVWILWAMTAWRRPLAGSCMAQTPEGRPVHRIAEIAVAHRLGLILSPLMFLWLVALALLRAGRKLLAEGNLLAYLRARALRRMSKKARKTDAAAPSFSLPARYVEQFPLYPLHGEEGEVLLPRRAQMDKVRGQIVRWRESGQDGSLVLVGEKGIGKTTFLALLERELSDIGVRRYVFAEKLRSGGDLSGGLCRQMGIAETDIRNLAGHLRSEGPQVILLDEAHNIFLRTVDGFRAVRALVNLVDATADKVFWVLVFNAYSWAFLKKVSNHVRAFRRVLRLPPWSQAELKELVAKRNERSGVTVEFDEVLLDAEASSTGGFELINSADGFFRLLWESSRGNPRVATYLWLNALTPLSERRIRVGLIREESSEFLDELGTGMLFVLASTAQHENLSFDELARALNIPPDEAVYAGRFLVEYGLLEPKHTDAERFTLAPRFHQQVIRALKSHHLLYGEEA